MQRVFHFSGGRTSAYMVIHNYQPGDLVLFCDTGREHSATYKFIHDFEAFENIPVKWLHYKGGWSALLKARQGIPNHFKRFCTEELKILTARRYLRSVGLFRYHQFIGFRYDEPDRVLHYTHRWQAVTTTFPLHETRLSKPDILQYWQLKPYTLLIPSILGNCTLCFEKGKNAVIAILSEFPELGDIWIQDEETDPQGYTYFPGITIRQLRNLSQNQLFKEYDLFKMQPAFNCSCSA